MSRKPTTLFVRIAIVRRGYLEDQIKALEPRAAIADCPEFVGFAPIYTTYEEASRGGDYQVMQIQTVPQPAPKKPTKRKAK